MEVYKFLWWKGRASLDSVLQHFSKSVMEDLDWLLKEKKISVHREPLGDLWIRCPAYVKKDPILELITLEPGITPTEAIERLGMTRKDFYQRLKKLDVDRVVEGRNTKLYISEASLNEPVAPLEESTLVPTPSEEREDRSEPVEEPEDPLMERARELGKYYGGRKGFEFTVEEIYQDLREGTGAVEEWIFERLSDRAQQVIEEFEEYSREDLMERFNLTKMEAINLYNELVASQLVEGLGGGIWKVK